MSDTGVRTLDLAETCCKNDDWFLTGQQRKEIRDAISTEIYISDEEIDDVVAALVKLGYAKGLVVRTKEKICPKCGARVTSSIQMPEGLIVDDCTNCTYHGGLYAKEIQ